MIRSMTGFGAASGRVGANHVSLEVRSVNHRFFHASIRLPAELGRWEVDVRESLRARVTRGHVSVTGRTESATGSVPAVNEERFASYVSLLRGLQARHGLSDAIDLATVLRLPDVVASGAPEDSSVSAELVSVVEKAADALMAMREAEGAKLASYLEERLVIVEECLARLEERAPLRVLEQRDRLRAAVADLVGGLAIDEQRLAQEVAFLAERLDVSEELSRFRAHAVAFRATLGRATGDPVGKRLGFLLQEMLREANTTGSKANDAAMLADVVAIKEELERLREQVENLE